VSRVFHVVDKDFYYRRCEERLEASKHEEAAYSLFLDMGGKESACITLDNFKNHFKAKTFFLRFRWLGVTAEPKMAEDEAKNADEAEKLVKLLGKDCNGQISIEEFLDGCKSLQGGATTNDARISTRILRS